MDPNDLLEAARPGRQAADRRPTPPVDARRPGRRPTPARRPWRWTTGACGGAATWSPRATGCGRPGTDEFAAADFFAPRSTPTRGCWRPCADPRRHEFLAPAAGHAGVPRAARRHPARRHRRRHRRRPLRRAVRRAQEGGRRRTARPTTLGREMAALRAVGRAVAEAGKEVERAARGGGGARAGAGVARGRTTRRRSRRCSGGSAATRPCGGSASWPAGSGGSPSRKQRQKATHGLDDVVGVEPGGDVGRLLPVRAGEARWSPSWSWTPCGGSSSGRPCAASTTPSSRSARGRSSSRSTSPGRMEGEKAHTAKALALALAWVARQQRRWCGLVAYCGRQRGAAARPAAGPVGRGQLWTGSSAFIGRGSTSTCRSGSCPDYYRRLGAPPGVTDVVFVTDARCRIPADVRDRVPGVEAGGPGPARHPGRRQPARRPGRRQRRGPPGPRPGPRRRRRRPGPVPVAARHPRCPAVGPPRRGPRPGSFVPHPYPKESTHDRMTRPAGPFPVAAGTRLLGRGDHLDLLRGRRHATRPGRRPRRRRAGRRRSPASWPRGTPSPGPARSSPTGGSSARSARTTPPSRFQFTPRPGTATGSSTRWRPCSPWTRRPGAVTCDLPGLATLAQEELDRCDRRPHRRRTSPGSSSGCSSGTPTCSRSGPQGGALLRPGRHAAFVDRVQALLGPAQRPGAAVPGPGRHRPRATGRVKEAVAAGLAALIAEHRQAVAEFGADTRDGTLERAAEKIRATRFKVEAYAESCWPRRRPGSPSTGSRCGDEPGQLVGTDGRQALIWGGFTFPFADDLLVPAVPVFGCKELAGEEVRVGRTVDPPGRGGRAVERCGCRSDAAGRYPDVAGVVPRSVERQRRRDRRAGRRRPAGRPARVCPARATRTGR